MAKKTEKPEPHPDDFMLVTVSLQFSAKLNPDVDDPPPFDTTEATSYCLPAVEATDYLEQVVKAIRERRLYGLMVQDRAESAVSAGEWIEKTTEEILADARSQEEQRSTEKESPSATD
jgi:hypothetical protein